MATKQEAEEMAEQVKMAEEEKTGSAPVEAPKEEGNLEAPAPEVLQVKTEAEPDDESVAEASTNMAVEQPATEQPEGEEIAGEKGEPSGVVVEEQGKELEAEQEVVDAAEETTVAEELKEMVEEAPVKAVQEEATEEQEKKEEVVEEAPVKAVQEESTEEQEKKEEVVEKIEHEDESKQEPVAEEETEPKGQAQVAEIKPRDSLGALMKEDREDPVVEEGATSVDQGAESVEAKEEGAKEPKEASAEELAPDAKGAEDKVEKDAVANGSTEQTQGQGDGVGDVAVTKDEETANEAVQEKGVEAVAEPEEENIKDADMSKESQEQTKEETPVKPVKQSNNLMSKVKNSLVKAKKAIIGKSPPKSDTTETKE